MSDDDAAATRADGTSSMSGDRPMHEPDTDYERGREDEASMRDGRFSRSDETARTDEPSVTRRDG
jgi:hypothetical protein